MVNKNDLEQVLFFINTKVNSGITKVNLSSFKEQLNPVLIKDLKEHINSRGYRGNLKMINGTLYFIYKGRYT